MSILSSIQSHNSVHSLLQTIPYCSKCQEYINTFSNIKLHDYSGWLEKRKMNNRFNNWKERYCVISNKHLAYYEHEDDVNTTLPKGIFHLSENCIIKHDNNDELCFDVTIDNIDYKFKALTNEDKQIWIKLFKLSDKRLSDTTNITRIHFCNECEKAIDLDIFTLADIDGPINVKNEQDNEFHLEWVVLAQNHIAIYHDDDQVRLYKPINVYDLKNVQIDQEKQCFTLKDQNNQIVTFQPSNDEYNDWLECIKENK